MPNQTSPEQSDSTEARRLALLKDRWNKDIALGISGVELEDLLLSDKFGLTVVEAIKKTDRQELIKDIKFGQEFGFVVYYDLADDAEFALSPLFEGEEFSINSGSQFEQYRDGNPNVGKTQLWFHTHPSLIDVSANIFAEALGIKIKDTEKYVEYDLFSVNDFRGFRILTGQENMSLIYTLGYKNPDVESSGALVLVSIGEFNRFLRFNPKEVVDKCYEYKRGKISTTPFEIYREAGLNAAVLQVELNSPSPFNPKEVVLASMALTTRKAA